MWWTPSPIQRKRRSIRSSSRKRYSEDRLFSAPHCSLWAGRDLRQHAWRRRQRWHRWPPWRLHHGLRNVRDPWPLGDRPRTAKLHYDFWWNLPRDYMVSSEWGLPPQFENGIVAEDLLSNKSGHHLHFWDLRARRNVRTIDLAPITRWRSKSARRMTRSANTVFWVSSLTQPI